MENQDKKNFAGKNGFTWWVGIVEDRKDPIKLGRCRVRCVGWHADDKMRLPTKDLPWATPSFPLNNTNTYAPKEGDMVFGFFVDGENAQEPVMLGVLPNIPLFAADRQKAYNDPRTQEQLDLSPLKPNETANNYPRYLDEPTTSRLARNDSDFVSPILTTKQTNKATRVEPDSYYNAQYPYNNVYESESGHALEFDDTKDNERIHMYHRSGSYVEFGPLGDRSERIQRDRFSVTVRNDNVYIQGTANIFVDGDVNWKVGGDFNLTVGGKMNVSAGSKTETIKGVSNIRYNGDHYRWYGSNFYDRRQSGKVDHSCPSDVRTGAISCDTVESATEVE
jgi:hypothetical protein